jgi:hypothetical protein
LAFAALCRACVTESYTRGDYRRMRLAAALGRPHPLDFQRILLRCNMSLLVVHVVSEHWLRIREG